MAWIDDLPNDAADAALADLERALGAPNGALSRRTRGRIAVMVSVTHHIGQCCQIDNHVMISIWMEH